MTGRANAAGDFLAVPDEASREARAAFRKLAEDTVRNLAEGYGWTEGE